MDGSDDSGVDEINLYQFVDFIDNIVLSLRCLFRGVLLILVQCITVERMLYIP